MMLCFDVPAILTEAASFGVCLQFMHEMDSEGTAMTLVTASNTFFTITNVLITCKFQLAHVVLNLP